MRILFWNTHNNENINAILTELILENSVDIVALVEYKAPIDKLLVSISQHGIQMQQYCTTGCEGIMIIGNIFDFKPGEQNDHYSFQIIKSKYIFCCLHLPSQIYTNNDGARVIRIQRIIKEISNAEKKNNTDSTIIVGDFNINPFDHGCIDANLFHSLPYFEIARKVTRTVEKQEYKMFYNPMWKFFGDGNIPAGTHYYNGSRIDNIFWHIYDQVMIRPSLRKFFIDDNLKIVTCTRSWSLLNHEGRPDKKKVSDHLPIVFEIKEDSNG